LALEAADFCKITQNNGPYAVQGQLSKVKYLLTYLLT